MKPPPFKYLVPTNLEEALSHLAEYGDEAKPLAGGQSLIPTMNFRLAQPEVLIDLNNIANLSYIRSSDDGGVLIGTMTRQRLVERDELIKTQAPLIYEAMPVIAHPQIRNRGTFGGNLAHADPASELPALALILNTRFALVKNGNVRWVSADQFFVDLFETALEPDELLLEIAIPPLPARTGYAFKEISRRQGDYAMVGAAATVTLDETGLCTDVRLVYFSVGPKPVEAFQAMELIMGEKLTPELIDQAAETAAEDDIDPQPDIHASVKYRRHLAKVLARQVLTTAASRVV